MSGLALVFHLDGRPASATDLSPMLAEMAARGPEGEDLLLAGPVALGHRHLATTPEAALEPMPLTDPGTGCLLTGDIRLDNRSELLQQFGLPAAGHSVGDGALVLRAWERWGEDCASHLLGDFAFALWDPRLQIVFAARDQMGMRQLLYSHREGRVFACSSSARATALAPDVPVRINELRFAEALVGFEWGSLTSTFYEEVFRLPPAHCLTINANNLTLRQYWTLTPPAPLRLKSDGEYAEAFREVLSEAVRARLRGGDCLGSMLSGGMDSGSVVALACRMTGASLPTFSSVGPDPASCVETGAIHEALGMPNLAPTLLDHSQMIPWAEDLIALAKRIEEPFDFHMTQPRLCYLAAHRAGLKVLLDGGAGDVVLGHGSQMARHVRAGRLLQAWRDAQGLQAFWGSGSEGPLHQLYVASRGALVPDALRRLRAAWRDRRLAPLPEGSAIDPDFAERVGLRRSLKEWEQGALLERVSFAEERIWSWPRSGLTVGRERYDRVAAALGMEARDPYMDRRLMMFCLSLPMDQFQANGWPKMIQRRAMAGLLPDPVRWRSGKEHLGWTFTQTLLRHWPDWPAAIPAQAPALAGRAICPGMSFEQRCTTPEKAPEPFLNHVLPSALFLATVLPNTAFSTQGSI